MNETTKELFKDLGISPSYTRMRIYYYLEEAKSHPTVDEIYQNLIEELPTLSKTTVYNVLKLFMEKNIVSSLNVGGNEMRYELVIEKHSHFTCSVCHQIYDIPHICTSIDEKIIPGFEIVDQEVNLKGICPSCKQK